MLFNVNGKKVSVNLAFCNFGWMNGRLVAAFNGYLVPVDTMELLCVENVEETQFLLTWKAELQKEKLLFVSASNGKYPLRKVILRLGEKLESLIAYPPHDIAFRSLFFDYLEGESWTYRLRIEEDKISMDEIFENIIWTTNWSSVSEAIEAFQKD